MQNNKNIQSIDSPKQRNTRPTLGYLVNEMGHGSDIVWSFYSDIARKQGLNLITFTGGALRSPRGFDAQRNVLYDLVSAERVDALIIGSGLTHFAGSKAVAEFCERYRPLPMVCAGAVLEGIPSLVTDSYPGMREAVVHLITHHGYRRIAFIRGPEHHAGAQARYQAYTDALKDYNIPFNQTLVAPGDFQTPSGKAAIRAFLDERRLCPTSDIEAIVAANDHMALGALEELQARGIRVPHDVTLIGHDNMTLTQYTTPPLTTVQQFWDMKTTLQIVEMLFAMMAGKVVPQEVVVPGKLVVRRSCNCRFRTVAQAGEQRGDRLETDEPFEVAFAARRQLLLAELEETALTFGVDLDPAWKNRLAETLLAEISGSSPGSFFPELEEMLTQITMAGGDVNACQNALSVLRRHALACLGRGDATSQTEDLLGQARALVGETAQLSRGKELLQLKEQNEILSEIVQKLSISFHIDELMNVLAQELPRLGIKRGYIVLYEDPAAPATWSRLILAYDEHGRMDLNADGLRFPSRQLLPGNVFPWEETYNLVVEPLYFREEHIGIFVCEAGPRTGEIYDTLRAHISTALQGALLLKEREHSYSEIRSLNQQLNEENLRMTLELEDIRALIEGKPKSLRWRNRKVLLDFLRRSEKVTVPEIAGNIGLSRTTARKLLNYFIKKKMVESVGKGESTEEGGKKPDLFIFNARHGYIIAIHLFFEEIYAALFDLRLSMVGTLTVPCRSDEGVNTMGDKICELIHRLLQSQGIDISQVIGIAVGIPGITNYEKGIVQTALHFSAWGKNVRFKDILQTKLQSSVPLHLDHHIRFQAFAEKAVGLAKDKKNVVVIEGGTALTAGILVKNQLKRGVHYLAGEIGHIVVNPNDKETCRCGNQGCFQVMVAAKRLLEMAEYGRQEHPESQIFQGKNSNTIRIEEIFQASNHGDPLACSIIDDVTTWFAIGLSNLMLIHDPEIIIFHGMYAGAGDYFLRTLQEKIHKHNPIENGWDVELAFSSFGKERGVLGGAAYVVAEYFNTHDLYKT